MVSTFIKELFLQQCYKALYVFYFSEVVKELTKLILSKLILNVVEFICIMFISFSAVVKK